MIQKDGIGKKIKKRFKIFWSNRKSVYICTHQNERKGVLNNNADVV